MRDSSIEKEFEPQNLTESTESKEALERGKELEEFQQEEKEALEEVLGAKNAKEKPKVGRFRKAMLAMTIGLTLFVSKPSFAERGEKPLPSREKIETQITDLQNQIQELENLKRQLEGVKAQEKREQREQELEKILDEHFSKPENISLGEPVVIARGLMEQYGVYVDEKHIGDIYSESRNFQFTKEELIAKVTKIFQEKKVKFEVAPGKEEESKITYQVSPEAEELLKKWGGSYNKRENTFEVGEFNVELDENTMYFSIAKISENRLLFFTIDYSGNITFLPCQNGILLEQKTKEVKIEF